MSYESWRISYQSSEQAARAAYAENQRLVAALAAVRGDGWQPIEACPNGTSRVVMFCDERDNIWIDTALDRSAAMTGYPPTHWRELPDRPTRGEA